MFVFRVLNAVPYSNEQGAKDVIASLHSFLTCNLLVGLAVLVSWKQFGGKPIECMVPTDFTSAWVQISYYQWMPFFLLFEAACFRLPCFIWKYFASQSGMRVGEILRLTTDEHNTVPEIRNENIEALRIHLQGALRFQKRLKMADVRELASAVDVLYSPFSTSVLSGTSNGAHIDRDDGRYPGMPCGLAEIHQRGPFPQSKAAGCGKNSASAMAEFRLPFLAIFVDTGSV
ncbi:Innexin [Teladorsagia circumcincta]|uniref:Innexin n=1 Tax=Teladorsagia circumcincta TaxID=45464 RepID=A0A2G9UAM0_TELCI|nr:Innexin [Teladorsagia circumcincta]